MECQWGDLEGLEAFVSWLCERGHVPRLKTFTLVILTRQKPLRDVTGCCSLMTNAHFPPYFVRSYSEGSKVVETGV